MARTLFVKRIGKRWVWGSETRRSVLAWAPRVLSGMDHHVMLLLSILYQLVRCLFGLTAVLVRRDLSKDAELLVLRHENTVLRRPATTGRTHPPPTPHQPLHPHPRGHPHRRLLHQDLQPNACPTHRCQPTPSPTRASSSPSHHHPPRRRLPHPRPHLPGRLKT